jgi:hypothetical protein
MKKTDTSKQNIKFLLGLTVSISILILVIPDSFGHGFDHDTTPSQKLGDQNVILKFSSSPVYDPETNAREVSFQIVEENSNNIVTGTVLNIKTTITNEFIFEYTSEPLNDGILIMEFVPTESEILSIAKQKNFVSKEFPDEPPYDLVSVSGNEFESGGLYFFEVEVLEAEEKVVKEPLGFFVQIPFPHKTFHEIEDPYFGKQVIRAVSYFDKTENFQYDHKTRKISTEMPFEWSSESINRTSYVHQEFTIPKTFGDLMVSAFKAKVNGVQIPSQLITLDEFWADARLVHIVLSHGDLAELQKRQDDSISGMKFELEPYQEDISFSSITENQKFRIIVKPINFEAGSSAKILLNILTGYPEQNPVGTSYDLSILSGEEILKTVNGKTTNSLEKPTEIKFAIPANTKNPINLVFFEVGDDPLAKTTLPIKVMSSSQTKNTENSFSNTIPEWVRNNAKWWAQGSIGDNDFVSGIQYLIKEGIMIIPETEKDPTLMNSENIPSWIKNNADWWSQGLITDEDFVKGIQYLVEQGIIKV